MYIKKIRKYIAKIIHKEVSHNSYCSTHIHTTAHTGNNNKNSNYCASENCRNEMGFLPARREGEI